MNVKIYILTLIFFFYSSHLWSQPLESGNNKENLKNIGWSVGIDDKTKVFNIKATDYPRAQARKLANQILFLASVGANMLIHSGQYRVPKPYAHEKDMRIADVLKWSLLSVGKDTPAKPVPEIMEGIPDRDLFGLMREDLFLCWSPYAQLMITIETGLKKLENCLEKGVSLDLKGLKVNVELSLGPPASMFEKVEVSITYDALLFENSPLKIERFCQNYYSGIEKDMESNTEVREILADFYPEPDSFPKQKINVGGVKLSLKMAQNFQYSLWDTRVSEFNKPTETLWFSFLLVTPDIGDPDGKIDTKKVDYLASLLEDELKTYFVSPISIHRVLWKDLKLKERNIRENRDKLTPEEAVYLRQFTERTMMSQLDSPINQCWYSSFILYMSRSFFDKVPFGNKWMYIYTYLPGGEKKQIKLFRRDGLAPTPWPGDYKIKFMNDGDNYVLQVDNCPIFQKWLVKNYPSAEGKDEEIILDLFYQDTEGEHRVGGSAELGQGPVLKSAVVHPESVLLYQVEGYALSANYVREIIGQLQYTDYMFRPYGKCIVISQVGPVVIPLAGRFMHTGCPWCPGLEIHTIRWEQIPPPPAEDRTFPNMVNNFNFELLYIDTDEDLPQVESGTLQKICSLYDKGNIDQNTVACLLEEIFKKLRDRVVLITPELAEFYAKPSIKAMFQYEYKGGHLLTLRISAPGQFIRPEDFKGNHPEIYTNPKSKGQMVFIWKITPKKAYDEGKCEHGYPIYIVEPTLRLFETKKSVFFKDIK